MRIGGIAVSAAALCLATLLPSVANAGIIFDQQVDLTAVAFAAEPGFPQELADDFQLQSGANTITDIHWWGLYAFSNTPTGPDDFTIRIYADISGNPDSSPLDEIAVGNVERVDTGVDDTGSDVYAYSIQIAPLALTANTTYWLSISNDTAADTNDFWYWSGVFGSGPAFFRQGVPTWSSFDFRVGFQLTNDGLTAVPEPASVALFLAGLLSLGWLNSRRKA